MQDMAITFLGTGASQGVPMVACACAVCRSCNVKDKRLRTSLHLAVNGKSIVIDTGLDFRQQMLREKIDRLDAILFTHHHKDHTGGLDDIRGFYLQQQQKAIPVYARPSVITHLQQTHAHLFAKFRPPELPKLALNVLDNTPFYIDNLEIIPISLHHNRLAILGFRIGKFTYITDARHIEASEIEKIQGSEVFVVNALQKAPHPSHFNLTQAVALAKRINAQATYITHISHDLGLYNDVLQELPKKIQLAYDGLKIYL